MNVAAIVTAAGLSSRMHEFKPLMKLGESTVIGNVITSLKAAGINNIMVATGYKSELLCAYLKQFDINTCFNKDYARSNMFDSICLAINSLDTAYEKLLVMPGDVPLVAPETIRAMLGVDADVVRPLYNGHLGHPIIIDKGLIPYILCHDGRDGLRGAISACDCKIRDYEVNDIGTVIDADTKEDFTRLRSELMHRKKINDLWADIDITVGKDDVIFSHESAQFLEMIEYHGSIQCACASMHMSYSKAWKMLNKMERELGIDLVVRNSGGLNGGGTRLTENGKKYVSAYQQYRRDVRKFAEESFAKYFDCINSSVLYFD